MVRLELALVLVRLELALVLARLELALALVQVLLAQVQVSARDMVFPIDSFEPMDTDILDDLENLVLLN